MADQKRRSGGPERRWFSGYRRREPARGVLGQGIKIAGREALPYSMLAADLNKHGKPDIVVGYVHSPGAICFNDGTGRKYNRVPFGDEKGAIYGSRN